MSNDSSNQASPKPDKLSVSKSNIPSVPWNPWWAAIYVVVLYYFSKFFGIIIISLYPWLKHWSLSQGNDWVNNSIMAQFVYVLVVEVVMLASIYIFLKKHRSNFNLIGLRKPRWCDLGLGLLMAPLYYGLFVAAVAIASRVFHSLDVNQVQNIGFNGVHGIAQLAVTFISLVVLAPLVEEIMVRGFLYSSFHKAMPKIAAMLVTSLIFASAHLPEGGAAGPLYIAAIDTFILSLVLIYLREKTGSLWASISLHALKNGVAFLALFIINTH